MQMFISAVWNKEINLMTQIDQQQEVESQKPILEADDNKQRPLTDHLPSP
jgi:hypothetical protein